MKCPFYDDSDACAKHRDCLFNRHAGCAIVIAAKYAENAATKAEQTNKNIEILTDEIKYLRSEIRRIST